MSMAADLRFASGSPEPLAKLGPQLIWEEEGQKGLMAESLGK